MTADSDTPTHQSGIAFMLGAGALVAATSLMAKALGSGGDGLHPLQVSAGRFVFALVALGVFLAIRPSARPPLAGAQWNLHLARSVCGWLGVTAMFAAVARMPVAEATAVSFLSPLVTMGLAALMLRERLGPVRLTAAGLAVAGALLVLRPGTDAFQIAGLFALTAAALFGLESIFIKRLSDREPALRILLINNLIGGTVSLVAASFVWSWPLPGQWLLLAALGAVMVTGQSLFIQAMRRGEASAVIPAFYSVLVFAAVYDAVLYGVVPDGIGATGAALIMGSAVLLARRKGA